MTEPSTAEGGLGDRAERVVDAVRAHAAAIESAERGQLRVSWSDGEIRVVLETHFAKEPRQRQ